MKTRSCPVCEGTDSQAIAALNFLLFDDNPLHGAGDLVWCETCGAVYYTSNNTAEDYRRYYACNTNYLRPDTRGMGTLRASELARYRNTARILRKYTNISGLVADVGCGQGGCLRTLAEDKWGHLVGVDPLARNIESIRRAGLRAEQGFAEHIPLPDASCSAVILGHVLEHLYTPKHALAEIRRVLVAGGILYLEVPDASAYPAAKMAPFCDCIHEHINHFDVASSGNCLAASGFALLESGMQPLPGGCGGDACLYAVFQKQAYPLPIVADYTFATAMKKLSDEHQSRTVQTVQHLAKEEYRVHLWGISSYGMHISWLIAQTGMDLYVYDTSEIKRAHTLHNHAIAHPDTLLTHWNGQSRLVVPYSSYQEEIIRQAGTMIDPACIVSI